MAKKRNDREIYYNITKDLLHRFADGNGQNVVFSPFSVMILLGILADATGGETRDEVVKAIGCGEPDEITEWLSCIQRKMTDSGVLMSSNAVCVKESIRNSITPGYAEHLQNTFDGRLFSSSDMVEDVNCWVREKTNGMIPVIADRSMSSMPACLMNAVALDAKWEDEYEDSDIRPDVFHNHDGTNSKVNMMSSTEWNYVEDSHFTGFTKPYKDAGYSYMALLPKKEGTRYLQKAIAKLNLTDLFKSRKHYKVITKIPEYGLEFGDELSGYFRNIGIEKAFSERADFSPLSDEWLMVDKIIHKAMIRVDRNGTKAAAASILTCLAGCAIIDDYKSVILNRPFIFAIVHDDTALPVFAGIVNHLENDESIKDDPDDDFMEI